MTVIRGDLIHDRGAKQRTVFESEEPITGVEFREGPNTTLYLATTGRILTLTITGKGQGQPAKVLEDVGCGVGCMTFDEANGDIVVVRDDAIHYYGVGGRGPSFAYEGPKQLVNVYGDYIALVSSPQPSTSKINKGIRRAFGGSSADDVFHTTAFALLDTDLKYIAYTETLTTSVKALFIEWGDLFLLTLDGKVGFHLELTTTPYVSSCSVITRKLCNRSSIFSTSVISTFWLSILRRRLASIRFSAMLYFASTEIICIKREIMTPQCSSI